MAATNANGDTFGFILTRHVTSTAVNKYWNHCVRLLRKSYPGTPIIIIDDNSRPEFVFVDPDIAEDLVVIHSEYPGRGELLPYIYFLRHRWFPRAVILHDSIFIQRRIPFDQVHLPAIPLWHAPRDRENVANVVRLTAAMTPAAARLTCYSTGVLRALGEERGSICFGAMAVIQWTFLNHIETKYGLTQLIPIIRIRADRCSFERVLGAIFCAECPMLRTYPSLFSYIGDVYMAHKYTWAQYENDYTCGRVSAPIVKVWTGR
jgi:hypothetical protein